MARKQIESFSPRVLEYSSRAFALLSSCKRGGDAEKLRHDTITTTRPCFSNRPLPKRNGPGDEYENHGEAR
jgi:hypothetical protein